MNEQEILKKVKAITALAAEIEALLSPEQKTAVKKVEPELDLNDFESLKKALLSDKWPEAVNPNIICNPNNEADKLDRGRGIIEVLIDLNLTGKKFLDIGCGEGHCVAVSSEYKPGISVGYDIKQYPSWDAFRQRENVVLTTSFEDVKKNGPYDAIAIFDVLDHVEGEEMESLLAKAKSVLAEDGKIYLRTHPYSSRHGTHLYHHLNKAYVHLVFTPEELVKLTPEGTDMTMPNQKVLFPIRTYIRAIEAAELHIESRREITEKVESFFKIPKISERIMKLNSYDTFPEFQIGIQFVDIVLRHK